MINTNEDNQKIINLLNCDGYLFLINKGFIIKND